MSSTQLITLVHMPPERVIFLEDVMGQLTEPELGCQNVSAVVLGDAVKLAVGVDGGSIGDSGPGLQAFKTIWLATPSPR